MKHFLRYAILIKLLFCFPAIMAQERQIWRNADVITDHRDLRTSERARGYMLDAAAARGILATTPYRSRSGAVGNTGNTVAFPSPEGPMETYRVLRTRVLAEGLAEKFPEIRSYKGVSLTHPERQIFFSIDNTGFHGMIRDGHTSWYLNPVSHGSNTIYLAAKDQLDPQSYQCLTEGKLISETRQKRTVQERSFDDSTLRTFRLALACTGEYATYHINRAGVSSGSENEQKAVVLSAMNTTMTRVNGVFENDLALTMEIIGNNDEIIFLDAANDGLTNDSGSSLLNEIQDVIDNAIGFNSYDIGHVFSTGGGGIAQVASPCTNNKARGVTGLSAPEGDLFAIDFVAHEMGHQLGATHTFNNSCSENRTSITAVEPGSGSTIMAYAGICPPNVTGQSDDYFHAISVQQIWQNITEGNSQCAATTAIANTPPVLTPPSNYLIPAGTPFVLRAEATDANNDNLTYSWEQQDNEITPQPPTSTATAGPVFRSRPPGDSPSRFFPDPADLLENTLDPTWETLPTVSRDLNFSILVRDNNPAGGQTARGDAAIEVIETETPFRVTSQGTPVTLQSGQTTTITWETGGTETAPFNTALVDIFLIVDGNFDDPVTIEENTPNDGSQEVVIPTEVSSSNARIMVKADDNIFFSINQATLSVQQSAFALELQTLEYRVCQPENLEVPFTYITFSGFNETTTFTTANEAPGLNVTFSNNTASTNNTNITMTVSDTDQLEPGINTFTLVATASGGTVREYPITINTFNNTFAAPVLVSPANSSTDILSDTTLQWESTENTTGYRVEIATDAGFSNIIEEATVSSTQYIPANLQQDTAYFWRVTPLNICAEGAPSTAFSFTTIPVNAALYQNNNSVELPADAPPGESFPLVRTSTINVDREGDLNKIRVGVDISHTYVQDLTLQLSSPDGTTITLVDQPCGEENDIRVVFDDEGSPLSCGTNPAIGGVVTPKDDLETFKGRPILGTWTLTVIDGFPQDGGFINSFTLEIFVNGDFKNDTDGDGVFDDVDQCPDTPAGDKVDITGCPIFSLPVTNYQIRTKGESCRNNQDGSIEITTERNLDYTATLTGNDGFQTADFTNSLTFNSLPAGIYQLCFTVGGEDDYNQCFDITIDEPEPLSVLSKPDTEAKVLELALEGGERYFIDLNGSITTTTENRITLSLKEGINTLKVSTTLPCQGEYKEEIIVGTGVSVYPNPAGKTLNLITSERNASIGIAIYSITGKRVKEFALSTNSSGKASATIADLSSGVYLLRISGAQTAKTIKLIKE